jgi:hypothetical protein
LQFANSGSPAAGGKNDIADNLLIYGKTGINDNLMH